MQSARAGRAFKDSSDLLFGGTGQTRSNVVSAVLRQPAAEGALIVDQTLNAPAAGHAAASRSAGPLHLLRIGGAQEDDAVFDDSFGHAEAAAEDRVGLE